MSVEPQELQRGVGATEGVVGRLTERALDRRVMGGGLELGGG